MSAWHFSAKFLMKNSSKIRITYVGDVDRTTVTETSCDRVVCECRISDDSRELFLLFLYERCHMSICWNFD